MTQVREVIIVSHTHWDREWYRTFQCFRFRLVDMMDRLLDFLLEHQAFAHFLLDGQSVMLEDYLAVRPERVPDVRLLVEQGRLGIGPWYVQPDEFLASGEALIRNLLLGHRVAEHLGGAIKVGWLPDTFGHVAQLPQILRGFNIDTFVSSRGLGDHLEEPALEFWWEAPDGSRVLALYQKGGYWNAGCLGYPYFWGDAHSRPPDPALAVDKLNQLVSELEPYASSPTVAIWNGADHLAPQESISDLIPVLNEQRPGITVRHGRVEDYAAVVRETDRELPLVHGELRGSCDQNLHASVLSSRVHLKRANHQVQRLLERYAEPLAAAAWLAGDSYPNERLWEAWRLLLQNHPHDSICGCSVDQVHCEMLTRFQQAQQIATCVVDRALEGLSRQIDMSWCRPDSIPVLVFNPLAHGRREVVDFTLRLPKQQQRYRVVGAEGVLGEVEVLSETLEMYPWMSREVPARDVSLQVPFWRECLRELDGLDIVDFEWGRKEGVATLRLRLAEWPLGSDRVVEQLHAEAAQWLPDTTIRLEPTCVLVHLAFLVDLPPCGYAAYAIAADDGPVSDCKAVQADDGSLENEHLRIEVSPQGWFTLMDKSTQHSFRQLHQFEDVADRGDCYDFCPLDGVEDAGVTVEGWPEIKMPRSGRLVQSLEIQQRIQVPAALAETGRSRSAAQVDLPITTVLTLRAGARYLEIRTRLDNMARDHRLRVLFPTGIETDVVHADGHFAVATRPAMPQVRKGWHQPPSTAQPHHTWFSTDDGENGLTVLSDGLPEHAGERGEEGLVLALTLLRSVGWLSRGDLSTREDHSGPATRTPEAQCLGDHSFRYGVLPYRGDPVTAGVHRHALDFDASPIVRCVASDRGTLPPRQSILSLHPSSLVLSALKRSDQDGSLVVRFYSVSESAVEASIGLGFRAVEAHRASAAESILEPLELSSEGSHCKLDVGPGEIVTLLLRPEVPWPT